MNFYFILLIFLIFGCSATTVQNTSKEEALRRRQQQRNFAKVFFRIGEGELYEVAFLSTLSSNRTRAGVQLQERAAATTTTLCRFLAKDQHLPDQPSAQRNFFVTFDFSHTTTPKTEEMQWKLSENLQWKEMQNISCAENGFCHASINASGLEYPLSLELKISPEFPLIRFHIKDCNIKNSSSSREKRNLSNKYHCNVKRDRHCRCDVTDIRSCCSSDPRYEGPFLCEECIERNSQCNFCDGRGDHCMTFEQQSQNYADVCTLPRKPGPCRAAIKQWHFDNESQRCESFYYGGCEGNGNRFDTRKDCERHCFRRNLKKITPTLNALQEGCFKLAANFLQSYDVKGRLRSFQASKSDLSKEFDQLKCTIR